ncbi:hypothetical protein [Dokdonella fugitiva]|jgi:hypothetical protein|uniref:Lipoprotein n=1 Tax=Dokdonella fugitiva TaxID=328517 RepID=A0A4R2IBW8_9GAMM|nr:hypothetical protein [Dokdonella fugitiva]MBA8885692.1 hypothetical protein [Dokdonella fugitiva]TCO41727.1 hypothetical protein EV148_10277 [Dokdonella fugitiva]
MRKILPIVALAVAATLSLGACSPGGEQVAVPAAEQKPAIPPMPANPTDKNAWKQYLVAVVTANMQGVKSNHPYMYFVPAGDDEASVADRNNQLENVRTVVSRGVLPGNMMAFGGPDSKLTSALIIDAFKDATPGSFKDVVVLFVGATAEGAAVKLALDPTGADVRFVEAK